MEYNYFGNTTNVKISKIGLGGGTFGNAYGDYEDDEAISLIREALSFGINYFDTAPFYGDGKSETLLGKALKEIPRDSFYISTKVGRYGTNWKTMFDCSEGRIRKEFEESLKRLGLKYVDLITVHDVEFFAESLDVILNSALPTVEKLKNEGKTKFIGISGYPVKSLVEVVEKSRVKIDYVMTYCRDTLMDDTLQQYIPELEKKGVSVINSGIFGMGLLTNTGPPMWHPATSEIKKLCREAVVYCQKHNVDISRIAMYYSLKQPGYSTYLIGMKDRSAFYKNIDVFQNGLNTTELQVLNNLREKYFKPGLQLHWEGIEFEKYKQKLLK